ncbi:hypothetical protein PLICRDRAFT_26902 [Plicaturopsis crispa FD-325 SS-3]|nr:hypothetical protein PLICRDRAFT_26902 [Plicaturopsis crispa FD-325 SS-3]
MFLYLCTFLPRVSIVQMMKTCIWLLQNFAPSVYETLTANDFNSSNCLGVLLNPRNDFVDYALHVRHIVYSFTWQNDVLLAFPRLCEGLRRTHNLLRLRLLVERRHSGFLVDCLQRYGIFASSQSQFPDVFRYVPLLRDLSVSSGKAICELVLLRPLVNVSLGVYLASEFKNDIKPMIQRSGTHTRIRTIAVSITQQSDDDVGLPEIFGQFPELRRVDLQQYAVNPMIVLERLCAHPATHGKLASININAHVDSFISLHGFRRKRNSADRAHELHLQQKYLNNIIDKYSSIEIVKFTYHTWKLDSRFRLWTPKPTRATACWWNRAVISYTRGELSKMTLDKRMVRAQADVLIFWGMTYPLANGVGDRRLEC